MEIRQRELGEETWECVQTRPTTDQWERMFHVCDSQWEDSDTGVWIQTCNPLLHMTIMMLLDVGQTEIPSIWTRSQEGETTETDCIRFEQSFVSQNVKNKTICN